MLFGRIPLPISDGERAWLLDLLLAIRLPLGILLAVFLVRLTLRLSVRSVGKSWKVAFPGFLSFAGLPLASVEKALPSLLCPLGRWVICCSF